MILLLSSHLFKFSQFWCRLFLSGLYLMNQQVRKILVSQGSNTAVKPSNQRWHEKLSVDKKQVWDLGIFVPVNSADKK